MANLVYCLDGTTNTYDAAYPTNVVMMHKSVAEVTPNGTSQYTYYDAGVGTKLGQNLLGMCFGYGLMKNVLQAYEDLCLRFKQGDQIFIVGFSRGAYTARSLAGFIGYVGILDDPSAENLQRAELFYKNRLNDSEKHIEGFPEWRRQNSTKFCANKDDLEYRTSNATSQADVPEIIQIRYIGVWDTVKTLGLNEKRYDWHDHDLSEHVDFARHAIALDERRNKFQVTPWSNIPVLNEMARLTEREGRPYRQEFFPGTHGSVGGGGPVKGLSDDVFQWIKKGAEEAGLSFKRTADGELFELAPNALDWLDNIVGKPMSFLAKRMNKFANFGIGIFGYSDRDGPTNIDDLSHSAKVRYYADPEFLPEKTAYRPGSLSELEPLLDKMGSPFSDVHYRALRESAVGKLIKHDEEKYVTVGGKRYRVHVVEKGDTLSRLADHYLGDPAKWPEIYSANKATISDPNVIYVSQRILIPAPVSTPTGKGSSNAA